MKIQILMKRLYYKLLSPAIKKKAKFIAIPTTAGTGSETSSSAILTTEDNKKIPIVTNDFLPDLSILDSTLLTGIPMKVLVPSMLDALAHCLEGYVSKIDNIMANNLASLCLLNLYNAFKNLDQGYHYQDCSHWFLLCWNYPKY